VRTRATTSYRKRSWRYCGRREHSTRRAGPLRRISSASRHLVLKRLGALYRSCATDNVDGTTECVATQEDALESLSRAETIDAVRAAVQSLPPVYREVVVLCELQEMDYAAAADVIGCPIGTVRSRLHRARAMLTTKLASACPAVVVRGE